MILFLIAAGVLTIGGLLPILSTPTPTSPLSVAPENETDKETWEAIKIAIEDAKRENTALSGRNSMSGGADLHPAAKPKTSWHYSTDIPGGMTDDMTGKEIRTAATISTNSHDLQWPHGKGVTATLRLRKHPRYGNDIIVELTAGQILCDSYDGCHIPVRFDDKPMRTFTGAPPSDHGITTIFIRGYDKFLKAARAAQKVTIEIKLYQDGNRTFTFDVSGLEWP